MIQTDMGKQSTRINIQLKESIRPYKAQFHRSPLWVRAVETVCLIYIVIPIDLFDILFPWMAYSDDVFIAGLLLKLLHKYGSLPEEDPIKPIELIKQILSKKERD